MSLDSHTVTHTHTQREREKEKNQTMEKKRKERDTVRAHNKPKRKLIRSKHFRPSDESMRGREYNRLYCEHRDAGGLVPAAQCYSKTRLSVTVKVKMAGSAVEI